MKFIDRYSVPISEVDSFPNFYNLSIIPQTFLPLSAFSITIYLINVQWCSKNDLGGIFKFSIDV